MKLLLFALVVLGVFLPEIHSTCHTLSYYDPWAVKNKVYACARQFNAPGSSSDANNACRTCNGGNPYVIRDEAQASTDSGHYYAFGSVVVHDGCTLTGYGSGGIFGGKAYPIEAGVHYHDEGPIYGEPCGTGSGRVYGYEAYVCTCQQAPIECTPDDGWSIIYNYDNGLSSSAILKYKRTVGKKYSKQVTQSNKFSAELNATIKANFFYLFQANLDISANTQYNWNSVTEEEESDEVTVEVGITVPAHTNIVVKQAVGTCGGSTAKTRMVKAEEIRSGTGEFIREYYHIDGNKIDILTGEVLED